MGGARQFWGVSRMWTARGGARAGSGRGGRCLDVLSGLKVGSGRPASATGSHLAPDTIFVGIYLRLLHVSAEAGA
eukprot:scaffold13316_cov100-Isochrysis_galbana.AAC.1